jgi:type II restriction/modification system DNA methylase subunit YeeA
MVTDIITLKLIAINLNKVQSNIDSGSICDIFISGKSNINATQNKSIGFANISALNTEIAKYDKVDFKNVQCFTLNLFQLKKFNVKISKDKTTNSNANIVKFSESDGIYTTTSGNINKANMYILNDTYLKHFRDISNKWNTLILEEYIKIQRQYIDCGYIQVYFEDVVKSIKELYKKYKEQNG